MNIITSRFGPLEIRGESVILFPNGMMGWEECREWVLLADAQNDSLAWLQSIERPDVALAVVSPRRFVPGYRIMISRRELAALGLDDVKSANVLAIVGKTSRSMTLNLKAPLLINPVRRLGSQVIAQGDLPVQYELEGANTMRKSA
jgi:flagellar assembly factor FliW